MMRKFALSSKGMVDHVDEFTAGCAGRSDGGPGSGVGSVGDINKVVSRRKSPILEPRP